MACLEYPVVARGAADSRVVPPVSELRARLPALLPELRGRALRLGRDPALAHDLVQDTVERALRFESCYRPGTNVRAWVHQILSSVFVTRCRRARRERVALAWLATDPCAWTAGDPPGAPPALSPATEHAVAALPAAFGAVVRLVDLEEMSYRDAAERLGVPVGTVMSRLHRGRRMLAAKLGPRDGERKAA